MRLIASDFYTFYRPSECDLRVYLRHKGIAEAPPSPYEEVLRRLGERHEKAHLATFPGSPRGTLLHSLRYEVAPNQEVYSAGLSSLRRMSFFARL